MIFMEWNAAFDYSASFMIMLVVIWYFSEKRIPEKAHKLFLGLIVLVLVATCLEVSAIHLSMLEETDKITINNLFSIYFFVVNLAPVLFVFYIARVAHLSKDSKQTARFFCIIAIVVDVVLTVLNIAKNALFVFENGEFDFKAASIIFLIVDFLLGSSCIVILVKNSRGLKFNRSLAVCVNIVVCFLATAVQIKYSIMLVNISMATMCLTLFYYLQNPDAVMDIVTNQFNRKYLGDYVPSVFSDGESFGVVVLALDDFKFVNKTYGVDNGDNLLAQVGAYIDSISGRNIVFRYGADQFAVVIRKNTAKIDTLAQNIHERFRHPWFIDEGSSVMMSASICCVECPRDADSYGELIEVIDYSMAVAKKTKKGGIINTSEIELDKIRNDKAIEKEIKLALDRDEFQVYYQPIYSVHKGCYNSAEALVRLKTEAFGWISPEVFIPLAEKNGMILELGDLIFEKVCKFIKDNNLSQTTIEYIEVNISTVQLVQPDFAEKIKSIMEKYEVKPDQINIEITETATLGSMTIINDNINALTEYGIKFSLDDYGSGNANIDYINRMPFSIIKLDKFIVWDAFKNDKAGITLDYTIGMLNALKLLIVAEGVETEEMNNHLADIGCHYMQGWYYSKAVSDEEFMDIIKKSA